MGPKTAIENSSTLLFEEVSELLFSGQLFDNIDSYLDSNRFTVKSKWPARQHNITENQGTVTVESFEDEDNEKKLVQRLICYSDGTVQIYQLKSISWGYQPNTDEWSIIATSWESIRWDSKKQGRLWQIVSQAIEWIRKRIWRV